MCILHYAKFMMYVYSLIFHCPYAVFSVLLAFVSIRFYAINSDLLFLSCNGKGSFAQFKCPLLNLEKLLLLLSSVLFLRRILDIISWFIIIINIISIFHSILDIISWIAIIIIIIIVSFDLLFDALIYQVLLPEAYGKYRFCFECYCVVGEK